MKRIISLLGAALLSHLLLAQNVEQVTIGDNMNYGITYRLPQTAIRITVRAHCVKTEAGTFAPYAEKLLGLTDAAQSDETSCQITSISMQPFAMADPARTYHIEFSDKAALPTFYLDEDHCLLSINRAPELPAVVPPVVEAPATKLKYKPSDVMTSEMLKAGSKAKQAELVAEEVLSLRESRSDLIRGEADNTPKDGRQLELMLDNLSAQEAALLSLFVGNTTESDIEREYIYIPKEPVNRELIFRFSSEFGFVEPDDLSGAPYYLSVAMLEDNRLPELDAKQRKKVEKGIAYCVPGKARLSLQSSTETLSQGDVILSQFGHVDQLPQAQFIDKKRPTSALFVPSTGAIKLFEQEQ